jgi:hypothetical protein
MRNDAGNRSTRQTHATVFPEVGSPGFVRYQITIGNNLA